MPAVWDCRSWLRARFPPLLHQTAPRPRDIFKQLIEINTTDTPKGSVTAAAVAMQKRFLEAGFPPEDVHLLGPDPNKQNLVVRMRAAQPNAKKPVLFLCHMDVVEALPSDWTPILSSLSRRTASSTAAEPRI